MIIRHHGIARENGFCEPFASLVRTLLTACETLSQGLGNIKMAFKRGASFWEICPQVPSKELED